MSGTVRRGINLPLPGLALHEHRRVVESLTDLGYNEVWTGEGGGIDGLTPLAAAAAWNPALRVGTGVLPAATRGTGVLAQSAAALADLAPAGVMLGLGTSVPAHVTGLNDIPFERPVTRLKQTVAFLRSDDATVAGRPKAKILVGALRPKMVSYGLTEADGVIVNVLSADDLDRVLGEAPVPPTTAEFVVKVFVCPTGDTAFARRAGRRFLAWITNQAPYRAFQDWLGHADDFAASRAAYDHGDLAAAAEALPDEVVDRLWIHGTPRECARRLEEFVQPGVTSLLTYVAPTPDRIPLDSVLSDLRGTR